MTRSRHSRLLVAIVACLIFAFTATALEADPSSSSEMQSVSSNTEFVSVAERLHNTNQAMTGKRHGALKHRFRKVPSPRFAADVPPPSAPGTAGSTQTTPGGTTVVVQAATRGPFPLTEDGHIPWAAILIVLGSLIVCAVMVFTSFGQTWCMKPLCLTLDLACEVFLKSTKFIWSFFAGIFGFCFYPFKATFWWCYDKINKFYHPYLIVT